MYFFSLVGITIVIFITIFFDGSEYYNWTLFLNLVLNNDIICKSQFKKKKKSQKRTKDILLWDQRYFITSEFDEFAYLKNKKWKNYIFRKVLPGAFFFATIFVRAALNCMFIFLCTRIICHQSSETTARYGPKTRTIWKW